MKIRRLLFILMPFFLSTANAFAAAPSAENINDRLNSYTKQLSNIIPNAATEQNVYSDAWIGNFYPSSPMHFALGIEGGLTQLNMDDFNSVAKAFRIASVPETFPYPSLGINGKIGGFGIPFDMGVSFFTVDTAKLSNLLKGIDMQLFIVGGNIRFAILQGKGAWPVLSCGAAYYYSKSSIGTSSGDTFISFKNEAHILIAETQISKKFIFVTPFAGFRAIFVKSDSSFEWNNPSGILNNAGITVTSGKGSIKKEFSDQFIPQVFGGLGLTLGLIQFDTNVSYDIQNNLWSGGLSIRFQM